MAKRKQPPKAWWQLVFSLVGLQLSAVLILASPISPAPERLLNLLVIAGLFTAAHPGRR